MKLLVELPMVPVRANESEILPRLLPANPPRRVAASLSPRPLSPVTLPVANDFSIVPWLKPTSPPPVPIMPTLTLPVAQEKLAPIAQVDRSSTVVCTGVVVLVMVPEFSPTRPPALALSRSR